MQKTSTFFIVAFFLCSLLNISAQTLPAGTTNRGTDFWLSFPISFSQPSTANALKIYVSCEVATRCTVTIPGLGVMFIKNTIPNGIIEFSLDPGIGQPYEKDEKPSSIKSENETYSEGKGRGIHVSAPVPITVYGASRFANTSDSFVALPTSALGKEYIVASYADGTAATPEQHLISQTVIVAPYDNTVVNFKLGGAPGTQTVGGMKIGEVKLFKLMKGDIVAFANKKVNGINGDLSGSKITANKPVAVISGNQCAYVDVGTPSCDFIMEMELPTMSWGNEYHITNIKDRKKYSFIKVFAQGPNTRLFRDGNSIPFAVISTAGGTKGAGYYEGRVLDDGTEPRPVTIRADGPISITQFNPGQSDDNVLSDPFQMVLTPVEQFQKEITFNPPGTAGGVFFKNNYVNLVFEGNSDGTMPDDLEFGTVNFKSEIEWQPLKTVFNSSAEPFKTFPGDTKKYFQKTIILPDTKVYKIRALKPFTAYSYGYDNFDSYGHPASVSVKDMTVNDTMSPEFSFTAECNGTINDGRAEDLPKTETDTEQRSNMALVALLAGSKNYHLKSLEIIPGDHKTTTWKLYVEDQSQPAIAHVYFADRAGNDTTVTITYEPQSIVLPYSAIDFGFLKVGESKTMQFIVQNTSPSESQAITEVAIKGTKGFTFKNPPALPLTLQPSETKTFDVEFTSPYEGNFRDSILLKINNCTVIGSELIARTGSEPILEVTDADFGTSKVNTDAFKTIKLTNFGTFPLKITGYSGPSKPEFTLTGWPVINENSPYILDFGEELRLIVVFNAGAEGEYTDEIVFKSNAKISGTDSIGKLRATAELTVGIEEMPNTEFSISPNPATGFATITLPAFKSQSVFLKVFDAAGNEVADFSKDLLKTEFKFDTKVLPNGAYFLRYTDGKTMLNRSFIIQN